MNRNRENKKKLQSTVKRSFTKMLIHHRNEIIESNILSTCRNRVNIFYCIKKKKIQPANLNLINQTFLSSNSQNFQIEYCFYIQFGAISNPNMPTTDFNIHDFGAFTIYSDCLISLLVNRSKIKQHLISCYCFFSSEL